MSDLAEWKTVRLDRVGGGVWRLSLNRPHRGNAVDRDVFLELPSAIRYLTESQLDVRVLILEGIGKHFCVGLDLVGFSIADLMQGQQEVSRKALFTRKNIMQLQHSMSAMEKAPFPVIAAVHGACIGAGIDLITACDIRVCSSDAYFSVKEVDIGLAADIGTLQRLPKVVGSSSWVREVCLSCRRVPSEEALREGLVSKVLPDKDALQQYSLQLANSIASKSPVAVFATKNVLNFSRDHSVSTGLEYVATMNGACLQSEDIPIAAASALSTDNRALPTFSKL